MQYPTIANMATVPKKYKNSSIIPVPCTLICHVCGVCVYSSC